MVSPCAFAVLLVALVEGSGHPPLERVKGDNEEIKKIITDLSKPDGHLHNIEDLEKRLDARLDAYKEKLQVAIRRAKELADQVHTDFAKEAYLVETSHLRIVRPLIRGLDFAAELEKKKGDDHKVDNDQPSAWHPKLESNEDASGGERAKEYNELMNTEDVSQNPFPTDHLTSGGRKKWRIKGLIDKISAKFEGRTEQEERAVTDQIAMICEHRNQEIIQRLARMILDEAQKIREAKLRKQLVTMAANEGAWKKDAKNLSREIKGYATSVGAQLPSEGLDESEMEVVKTTDRQFRANRLAEVVLKSVVFSEVATTAGDTEAKLLEGFQKIVADATKEGELWDDHPAWTRKITELKGKLTAEAKEYDKLYPSDRDAANPSNDPDIDDYLGGKPMSEEVEKTDEADLMMETVNKARKEALAKILLDDKFKED